jgi:hypothetical protein
MKDASRRCQRLNKEISTYQEKGQKTTSPGFCFPARRLVFDAKLLTSEKYAFMDRLL